MDALAQADHAVKLQHKSHLCASSQSLSGPGFGRFFGMYEVHLQCDVCVSECCRRAHLIGVLLAACVVAFVPCMQLPGLLSFLSYGTIQISARILWILWQACSYRVE